MHDEDFDEVCRMADKIKNLEERNRNQAESMKNHSKRETDLLNEIAVLKKELEKKDYMKDNPEDLIGRKIFFMCKERIICSEIISVERTWCKDRGKITRMSALNVVPWEDENGTYWVEPTLPFFFSKNEIVDYLTREMKVYE